MADRICSVESCGRPHSCKGFCARHYEQGKRLGWSVYRPKAPAGLTLPEALAYYTPVGRTASDCWEWLGERNHDEYGKFGSVVFGYRFAHRMSWEVANNRIIPAGILVRHKCDNPPCVNPNHLELGTDADNCADSVERGRRFKKLTEVEVGAIRRRYADGGCTYQQLAKEFSVIPGTIGDIIRGRRWSRTMEIRPERPIR